ncbi:MAG: molybdopterin-binding protein, partial [Candidatus Thorarchaeota archaeon]
DLGAEMRRLVTVRDEIDEIGKGLMFLCEECDVVITSGGLGPTHDDMTLQAVGFALGRELREDEEALEIVKRQYKMLFRKKIVSSDEMTETRRKMAIIPIGSKALDNTVGGAPGVLIEYNDTTIFCLPGVPAELKDIWESSIRPWIVKNTRGSYFEEIVEFEIIDESVFAPFIQSVMQSHPSVWIKSMPKRYGTTKIMRVWISSRGTDDTEVKQNVADALLALERESGLTRLSDE